MYVCMYVYIYTCGSLRGGSMGSTPVEVAHHQARVLAHARHQTQHKQNGGSAWTIEGARVEVLCVDTYTCEHVLA